MSETADAGSEREVFAHAHSRKDYWSGRVAPFVQSQVLDVGQ